MKPECLQAFKTPCEGYEELRWEVERLNSSLIKYARCRNALSDLMVIVRDRVSTGQILMTETAEQIIADAEITLKAAQS